MHPYVHHTVIYNSQDTACRLVDRKTVVRLHGRILLGHKKEGNLEILPFTTTWMDLENIMLSEISQPEKDKYCVISLMCGI